MVQTEVGRSLARRFYTLRPGGNDQEQGKGRNDPITVARERNRAQSSPSSLMPCGFQSMKMGTEGLKQPTLTMGHNLIPPSIFLCSLFYRVGSFFELGRKLFCNAVSKRIGEHQHMRVTIIIRLDVRIPVLVKPADDFSSRQIQMLLEHLFQRLP